MKIDEIRAIGIDRDGSLWVKPSTSSDNFHFVYRAGMEVTWDSQRLRFFSPKPREWSYVRWFQQIKNAVSGECGVDLRIGPATQWSGIDAALQKEIAASIE